MNIRSFEERVNHVGMRTGDALRSRFGIWGIAIISFLESALLVPILTDPFLVAYILAHKGKVIRGVVVTTVASVLGGAIAYLAAVGFFELLVAPYLGESSRATFDTFVVQFEEGIFLLTLIGAVTPIPYTLVALAAGVVKGNFFIFLLASFIGRGFRYILVGWLTERFGERALAVARKQIRLVTILVFVVAALYLYMHLR